MGIYEVPYHQTLKLLQTLIGYFVYTLLATVLIMKLNERQTLARKRVGKISMAIQEAIDKICEDENFEISYAEINAAVIYVLKSNNSFELRELWQPSDESDDAS